MISPLQRYCFYLKRNVERLVGKDHLIDMRKHTDSPLEVMGDHKARGRWMFDIPIGRCRAMGPMGFSCVHGGPHPYVTAVEHYLESRQFDACLDALVGYYSKVQPTSAADLLNLTDSSSPLHSLPPLQGEVPWKEASGPRVADRRRRRSASELGCPLAYITEDNATNLFGPTTIQRIRIEAKRLVMVTESVSKYGFKDGCSTSDYVTGWLLVNDENDWVVDIAGGKHRLAVLGALGYETVPLVLATQRLVRRRNARDWPGVLARQFTELNAQSVFDDIFVDKHRGTGN